MSQSQALKQKEKKIKSYHITFDLCPDFLLDPKDYHMSCECPEDCIEESIRASECYMKSLPYLLVREIGVTGKLHYHMYFHSTKCKNTLKKHLEQITKATVYFSDPNNVKYSKYNKDGVLGVEIYLSKGFTNHMKMDDDLKVTPSYIFYNMEYYGNHLDEGSKLEFIRSKYELAITEMRKYKKQVAEISSERKMNEWQEILKDISVSPLHSTTDIKQYLCYQHYTKEKYTFTENGAKNLYRRILKKIDINSYKNLIMNKMDLICD